jgi:hypothetical protein
MTKNKVNRWLHKQEITEKKSEDNAFPASRSRRAVTPPPRAIANPDQSGITTHALCDRKEIRQRIWLHRRCDPLEDP